MVTYFSKGQLIIWETYFLELKLSYMGNIFSRKYGKHIFLRSNNHMGKYFLGVKLSYGKYIFWRSNNGKHVFWFSNYHMGNISLSLEYNFLGWHMIWKWQRPDFKDVWHTAFTSLKHWNWSPPSLQF